MPVWPVVPFRAAVLLALLAGLLPEGRPPEPPPEASCPLEADLRLPVNLTARIVNAPEPGGILQVRVEVEARRAVGPVRVRVSPPAGVGLLTGAERTLGVLLPGGPAGLDMTFQLPPGRARTTIEVWAEVELDEGILRRATVVNVVFDPEPSRRVRRPDGVAVREVRAERLR
jgi:hypothetical protein